MKKILLLLVVAACFRGTPALAQTSSSNTAVVRIRESDAWSNILVTYGPGKTELTELKQYPNYKTQQANAEQIQMVFDKLFAVGYVLEGSLDSPGTSTLIFRNP